MQRPFWRLLLVVRLAQHSAAHVARVVKEINNRPRKLLGHDTPAQRLRADHAQPAQV
jgi:IS30 family transposase